jgi:hypothetical protein
MGNGVKVIFPGIKWLMPGVDHPPLSLAEVRTK